MRKKIIFIAESIRKISYDTLKIDELKKIYDVEIWKLGLIINKNMTEDMFTKGIPGIRFRTWREFLTKLVKQDFSNTVFIFYSFWGNQLKKTKIFIKCLGGVYCNFRNYSYFNYTNECIESKIPKYHYMDLFLPAYNFLGTKYDMMILNSQYELKHVDCVMLHATNYDTYLLEMEKKEKSPRDYIVYIDSNPIYAYDYILYGDKKIYKNKKMYIDELRKFLDFIEKKYNMPIVIAAKPESPNTIREMYGDRKIIYNNTCKCVRYSRFVISTGSAAINFAFLFNKFDHFYSDIHQIISNINHVELVLNELILYYYH